MFVIARILFFLHLFQRIHSSPVPASDSCTGNPHSNLCVKLGLKYYLIDGSSTLNWFDAERFCRRQNGFLATIENPAEMRLISQYLLNRNYDLDVHSFWISGNDLGSEGKFYSISSGKLLQFTNWSHWEPNNFGLENCVYLWKKPKGMEMNDARCDEENHFICELENSN